MELQALRENVKDTQLNETNKATSISAQLTYEAYKKISIPRIISDVVDPLFHSVADCKTTRITEEEIDLGLKLLGNKSPSSIQNRCLACARSQTTMFSSSIQSDHPTTNLPSLSGLRIGN